MKARWLLCLFIVACGDNTNVNQTLGLAPLHLTTAEDSSVSATVTVTGGDSMLQLSATPPSHGTATVSGMTVTYTPDQDFNGTDTLTVKATDGLLTAQAMVDITITAVNDPPVANDDSLAGTEGIPLAIPSAMLLANDTDVEGDTLTVTGASNPTHGTVDFAADVVTFTPEAGFHDVATFDYTVSDGSAESTGHVSITFGINHPPVAVDDEFTTTEDTDLVVTSTMLVENDTDADNNTLSVQSVSGGTHGTVALAGSNITFTPDANFNGDAAFDYVVTDGIDTDTGHVVVHVTAVNDAPIAVDDAANTDEDTTVSIPIAALLANDSDPDGDTITLAAVNNATHGTAAVNGANVDFVPAANFNGTAGFDYTITDGNLTDTGHVTVTIAAVNDAPVAVNDTAFAIVDTARVLQAQTLLANDTDVDGDTLTISTVQNPVNGTVDMAGTTITFTPTAAFTGAASFDYTISDGTATATATVNVTVEAANTCGDGIVVDPETCDDQNAKAGDGCTACVVDNGFTCTGSPSVCTTTCGDGITAGTEQCDDHNTTNGDGCSSTCQFENVCLFTFTGAAGNEPTVNADSSATGVALPAMTRGAGVAVSNAANAFSGSSWNTADLDPTAFYSFTLTPDAGVTMNLLTFIFGDQRSATGPVTWSLRSSLDAFGADIATSATHPAPLTANTISLPAGQFLGLTAPIEFRIFGFGTANAAGTWRIDNVEVVGFTQGP